MAVDLANFLFPDARMNLLPMELELLGFYHQELLKALEELVFGYKKSMFISLWSSHVALIISFYKGFINSKVVNL